MEVDDEGDEFTLEYRMFVDCSGQKPLELEDFPFHSLVRDKNVRKARAEFAQPVREGDFPEGDADRLFEEGARVLYEIGGVDIDGTHRLIGTDGEPNPRIRDISFPHTTSVRPYLYGLQACSDTSEIVVRAWAREIESGRAVANAPEEITRIYEDVSDAVPS